MKYYFIYGVFKDAVAVSVSDYIALTSWRWRQYVSPKRRYLPSSSLRHRRSISIKSITVSKISSRSLSALQSWWEAKYTDLSRVIGPNCSVVGALKIGLHYSRSRGSSGSIVSDYGLDARVIEVRSPTVAEDFSSSPCVQTGSEAHLASYPVGTGGPFPGSKARPGRDADHSPPSSAEVKYE
jgi:hypothetical protein